MTTLLTGTLERTVGWFHPERPCASRKPSVPADGFALRVRGRRDAVRRGAHGCAYARAARIPLDLRLRQWLCAATRGHAFIMGIDGPRMYLICQHCFHETSGWELGGAAASGQVLSGLIVMHDAECTMHNRTAQPRGGMRNSRGRTC